MKTRTSILVYTLTVFLIAFVTRYTGMSFGASMFVAVGAFFLMISFECVFTRFIAGYWPWDIPVEGFKAKEMNRDE